MDAEACKQRSPVMTWSGHAALRAGDDWLLLSPPISALGVSWAVEEKKEAGGPHNLHEYDCNLGPELAAAGSL